MNSTLGFENTADRHVDDPHLSVNLLDYKVYQHDKDLRSKAFSYAALALDSPEARCLTDIPKQIE